MVVEKSNPEIYIQWNMLRECNFSCNYCVVKATHKIVQEVDIPKVVQRLDKLNKTLLIGFNGGEPFLIPNFTELCLELTKRHFIRIDTNLSLSNACKKFVNTINPDKVVEICFSTHVLEREKRGNDLKELCLLVKMFQEKGFKMIGNYVVYPSLITRMEEDIKFFDSQGIKVLPSLFWGIFNGKSYPLSEERISYSKEGMQLITKFNPYVKTQLHNIRKSFCQAGCAAFTINQKYEVLACSGISKKLGTFFEEWHVFRKVIRCPNQYCLCPPNRAPAVTLFPNNFPTTSMLQKAISEKGVYSFFMSFILIEASIVVHERMYSIFRHLRLRRSFFRFKK